MKLVLADIQPEPLARAESEIRALGVEALGVQTDVGDLAQVEALAERTFAPPCRLYITPLLGPGAETQPVCPMPIVHSV